MDKLRNIGIVAHINAGKTTLSERILFLSGKQRVMGEVDEGTATMDYLAEEQRRGISITAALATRVDWRGYQVNLIDTPGHVDFTAEVERCLRVLDGVVVVLDGVRGVESQTEMVWRQADARDIPRVVFVNKMDREGADFAASLDSLRERLECRPVALTWPLRRGGDLVGLHDLISGEEERWGDGGEVAEEALRAARAALLEACADFDETVFADFVEDRPVEPARIHAALRRGVLAGRLVPVLGGAALLNRGVAFLLNAICRYLPSPADQGAIASFHGGGERREPDEAAPFCALVFKSQLDGDADTHLARVYSGTVRAGERVAYAAPGPAGVDGPEHERPGSGEFEVAALWLLHADHREPLELAGPGDVIALESPVPLCTGDTLFAPGHPMQLEPVLFPLPVLSALLEPRSEADAAEVEAVARTLAADDPTLVVETDVERGGLIVSGMGELHLDVFGSRLRRRIGDRARLGRPAVAYMTTVEATGRGRAECRITAGPGEEPMRSIVEVEMAPDPGAGSATALAPVDLGPRQGPLLEALTARLRNGLADPYPAFDLRILLLDVAGEAHGPQREVLDLEALSVACRKALAVARPVLLEPLMQFAITSPADTLSGVLADLKSRSADIDHVETAAGGQRCEVRGVVPLAAVLGYATQLRSLTRGLGTLALTPKGYRRAAL